MPAFNFENDGRDPWKEQTRDEIIEWSSNLKPGDEICIRFGWGPLYKYELITTEGLSKNKSRVYTKHSSFYKSGINCFHPTGQTVMLIPTEHVRKLCKQGMVKKYTGI